MAAARWRRHGALCTSMVVEIYPGPGTEPRRSTKFAVLVLDAPLSTPFVYGPRRIVPFGTTDGSWVDGQLIEISHLTVGADQQVSVVVAKSGPPITSAVVYPKNAGIPWVVLGGLLNLTMQPGQKVIIEVNGIRGEPLMLSVDTLKPAIPPGAITYNGTQASVPNGTSLYFPPGVHNLVSAGVWAAPGFPVGSDTTIYIDGGALILGSFDFGASTRYRVTGPGVISGEWASWEALTPLPPATLRPYWLLRGDVGCEGSIIERVTLQRSPLFNCFAANIIRGIKVVSPWTPNTDGVGVTGDAANSDQSVVENCMIWCGDDGIHCSQWRGNLTVRNNLVSTRAGSFHFGYDQGNAGGSVTLITNNVLRQWGDYFNGEPVNDSEGGASFNSWHDWYDSDTPVGRFDVTVDGISIEGPASVPLFLFGNRAYPKAWQFPGFPENKDRAGMMSRFVLKNITMESAQPRRSRLWSKDWKNTPNNLTFSNVRIGGTLLTVDNWAEFVEEIGQFHYGFIVEGMPLATQVEVINLALSNLGDSGRVSSITPNDGSTQSSFAARYLPLAIKAALELHAWSFATKRHTLIPSVDQGVEGWPYAYFIPSDLVRLQLLLPEGANEDDPHLTDLSWTIERNVSNQLRLRTRDQVKTLRYTYYEPNPNRWSSLFLETVAWHLASMLAGPLIKGDVGSAQGIRFMEMARQVGGDAARNDAKSRQVKPAHVPQWLAGR